MPGRVTEADVESPVGRRPLQGWAPVRDGPRRSAGRPSVCSRSSPGGTGPVFGDGGTSGECGPGPPGGCSGRVCPHVLTSLLGSQARAWCASSATPAGGGRSAPLGVATGLTCARAHGLEVSARPGALGGGSGLWMGSQPSSVVRRDRRLHGFTHSVPKRTLQRGFPALLEGPQSPGRDPAARRGRRRLSSSLARVPWSESWSSRGL